MNNSELINIWMRQQPIPAEKLLQAPGLYVPTSWNDQQAVFNFAQPVPPILFGISLQSGTETIHLGLTQSAECTDLQLLAANVGSLADDLLLAVFEAQNTGLLQSLGTLFGKTPQCCAIVPIQDAIWQQTIPFALFTTEDKATVATGYLSIPASALPKVAQIDYLSLRDTTVISQAPCSALVSIAQVQLPPEDTVEAGDCLLLPEIADDDVSAVTLLCDNGLTLTADMSDGHIKLKELLDTSPVQPHDTVISLGTVSIHFADILSVCTGNDVSLPITPRATVWQNGRTIATGHITRLCDTPALEIETIEQ